MMIYTTLNKIREHSPCKEGWGKLLSYLDKTKAYDELLPLVTALDSNGLDDALWCCRTLPEYDKEWRLFAVWCARRVQHLMADDRSIAAIDVAERYAHGCATDEELNAALDAAWDAERDAERYAGHGAGRAAAWAASRSASRAAARAAWRAAEWEAWQGAEWDAARAEQEAEFRRIIAGEGL